MINIGFHIRRALLCYTVLVSMDGIWAHNFDLLDFLVREPAVPVCNRQERQVLTANGIPCRLDSCDAEKIDAVSK